MRLRPSFIAQSLGLNSSHNNGDQYEEEDAKLTEDQRDAKRGTGMQLDVTGTIP